MSGKPPLSETKSDLEEAPTLNEVVRLIARLVAFWREKVTVSQGSKPSGWACSAS